MEKQQVIGLAVAVVVGLAGGYAVRSATGPHVIMDPACQGQKMAMRGNSMDMMAGVDQTNPAAVDASFMSGMVPHHESAIAASRVVIEHGEDSAVKGLAENIIKGQQSEIDFMNGWLGSHGLNAGASHSDTNALPAGSSGMANNAGANGATNVNVLPAAGPKITILSPSESVSSAVKDADPNAQPNGADTE